MAPSSSARQFQVLRPESPRTDRRLICLPYAGGSAAVFRPWVGLLPPTIAITAIELPGHGTRLVEAPLTSMNELMDQLLASIDPFEREYALFGHSLGAALAFELTIRLQDRGWPGPGQLFVSGQRALHRPPPRPPIHDLDDEEFLAEVSRYGGTPLELFEDSEMRALFLPILRADFVLGETYAYDVTRKVECPLTAYGGLADEEVTSEDIKAWSSYTSRRFKFRMFAGNHFFLHSNEHLVAAALTQDLYEAFS